MGRNNEDFKWSREDHEDLWGPIEPAELHAKLAEKVITEINSKKLGKNKK